MHTADEEKKIDKCIKQLRAEVTCMCKFALLRANLMEPLCTHSKLYPLSFKSSTALTVKPIHARLTAQHYDASEHVIAE